VYIHLQHPLSIDKLVVNVASPAYYLRQAEVKAAYTTRDKRKREKIGYETVASATLSSSADTAIFPGSLYTQDFYLLIHNADNVPLQIKDVKAYQLNTYLIASLKKGETYHIRFGQNKLSSPVYDLAYFTDKLPASIPAIQVQAISAIAPTPATESSGTFWFADKMLIWGVIGLVILLLGYMSFQIVKDMRRNQ
jgi:hypothetical protein